MSLIRGFALNSTDILVLSTFAVAQPVFNLLSNSPGFLVARQSQPLDILFLVAGLVIGLPLACFLCEALALVLGSNLLKFLHGWLVAVFLTLFLLPVLKKVPSISDLWVLLGAAGLAAALTLAYLRIRTYKKSLVFLTPAVLIFPLWFLFGSPVFRLVINKELPKEGAQRAGRPAPVVMIVFDEFPLSSLLNSDLQINSQRYPYFADLAKHANWYRNATTVSEATLSAMPSVLTGRYPRPILALLPNATDYPRNLFTLLSASYQFNVQENLTRLCPESLCGGNSDESSWHQQARSLLSDLTVLYLYFVLPKNMTAGLPDITHSWRNFAQKQPERNRPIRELMAQYENMPDWENRPSQFRNFVDSIRPSAKPTLHFLHILLPHAVWEFLPSGRKYTLDMEIRGTRGINAEGADPNLWCEDPGTVAESYQRHLLQVQLVDHLVGYLIKHLKEVGLFEPSLLVLAADHGCSFKTGDSRRLATSTNYADILSVPLFIKTPYQSYGAVDDRNVEVVDIVPTVAKILDIAVPWDMDGYALTDESPLERNHKRVIHENGETVRFPPGLDARIKTVQKKLSLFGTGESPEQLFKTGPFSSLVGRGVTENLVGLGSSERYELDNGDFFTAVDFNSPLLLTHITGRILTSVGGPFKSRSVAVAVNGTIWGTARTYQRANEERFSIVTPESAYQEGHNEIAVYQVSQSGNLSELRRPDLEPNYTWGDTIYFGISGNAKQYAMDGWGVPDQTYTWIVGQRAQLSLRTAPPVGPIVLKARVQAYVHPPELRSQKIRVWVNRRLAGEWLFKNQDVHEEILTLPQSMFDMPNQTVIAIEASDAVAPVSVGDGSDIRKLGLAVYWLSFNVPGTGQVASR